MSDLDLGKCPFCGSKHLSPEATDLAKRVDLYVVCLDCGAKGPVEVYTGPFPIDPEVLTGLVHIAVAAWNQRGVQPTEGNETHDSRDEPS